MNINWLLFIETLSLKICILIFFCILCKKLWISHGLPNFKEEFQKKISEQKAHETTQSSCQATLNKTINESRLKQLKREKIQATFFAWQQKLSDELKEQKKAEAVRIQTYQEKIKNKQSLINFHLEHKKTLEEIMCQMRKKLTKSYSHESGAQKLAASISKIIIQAKQELT